MASAPCSRIERRLFDGAPAPVDGALRPDRSRPGLGLDLKRADAEKFGEVKPVRVCGPGDIGTLLTDRDAPRHTLAAFEAAGVRVIVA